MSDDIMHLPWLGRTISIVESPDSTLVGQNGQILDESRNMITIRNQNGQKKLAKSVITFTLDGGSTILNGAELRQAPENRIGRRYNRK